MQTILHPVYFPNIATLSVLIKKEVTWEIHDNFQKQTYRNRCYICTDQGKHMLNIPIVHVGGSQGRQKYKDVKLDNSSNWQRQHWRTLQTAYRTSPFFEFYEDDLAPIFEKPHTHLFDLNLKTVAFLCSNLPLEMPKSTTSKYEIEITGKEDMRHLVKAKQNITLNQPEYNQVFGDRHGFVKNTSVLDLLFNEGPNTLNYLKQLPDLV